MFLKGNVCIITSPAQIFKRIAFANGLEFIP
jgi:hypothetical protein